MDLAWGVFGENFTTVGLLEETLHIGDRLRVGSAEFVVTQPRMPCFKLGIRFNRPGYGEAIPEEWSYSASTLPFLKKGKSLLAIRSSCLKEISTTSRSRTL